MDLDAVICQVLDYKIQSELKKQLFYKRSYGDRFLLYSNCSDEINNEIVIRSNWSINFAESDMDFQFF